MGWASDSQLFGKVIKALKPEPEATRERLYRLLLPDFETKDWDTLGECIGEDPVYDRVIRELHPAWFEES